MPPVYAATRPAIPSKPAQVTTAKALVAQWTSVLRLAKMPCHANVN